MSRPSNRPSVQMFVFNQQTDEPNWEGKWPRTVFSARSFIFEDKTVGGETAWLHLLNFHQC